MGAHEGGTLSRAEFERVVSEALDSLPKRFADLVENVVIAVEDEPSAEDLEALEDDGHDEEEGEAELLGIYRGVALTEREGGDPLLPDEIAIFRGPINRARINSQLNCKWPNAIIKMLTNATESD